MYVKKGAVATQLDASNQQEPSRGSSQQQEGDVSLFGTLVSCEFMVYYRYVLQRNMFKLEAKMNCKYLTGDNFLFVNTTVCLKMCTKLRDGC